MFNIIYRQKFAVRPGQKPDSHVLIPKNGHFAGHAYQAHSKSTKKLTDKAARKPTYSNYEILYLRIYEKFMT